ncbi:MAG: methyltransferase domain-containing protein [Phycisphaerae bacterium]|nr:methyltransferase domain-containing protein [Phycisphaerae bacterium]
MLDFVRQAIRDFRHTGSLWPSSPQLAKAMTRAIGSLPAPRRILEVGPGTGPFTRVLLEHLEPGDRLDLVELNRSFCKELDRRLLRSFRDEHPSIEVRMHCARIEEVVLDPPYDVIICGLPFNNFPPKLVRSIFRRLLLLLRPGGELVYFEYAGVRAMKWSVAGAKTRHSLRRISAVGRGLRRRHSGRRTFVLGNLPPAISVRLRKR